MLLLCCVLGVVAAVVCLLSVVGLVVAVVCVLSVVGFVAVCTSSANTNTHILSVRTQ